MAEGQTIMKEEVIIIYIVQIGSYSDLKSFVSFRYQLIWKVAHLDKRTAVS